MTTTATAGPQRLGALDPLRGILALCVAVYHLSVWFRLTPSGSWANMVFARLGNYGVSAFFVLSGFVLVRTTPWSRVRSEGLLRFWRRRFLRLAPVFYLAVGMNLALHLGMGPSPSAQYLVENLTFTFGAVHPNHALVIGGWYVGLVALLYFAYPLVAWLREKGGTWFLAAAALALTAWSAPSTLHGVMDQPPAYRFHAYVLAPNQVFLLGWGALLAGLHAGTERRLHPWIVGALALPLVAALVSPAPLFYDHLAAVTGPWRYGYLAAVTGLVALAAFSRDDAKVPVAKAFSRVGQWSFGLYLLHPFAMKLVAPRVPGLAGFALSLGLSLVAAAAVHRWLEAPVERWENSLGRLTATGTRSPA